MKKQTRTISGVTPVAVMSRPAPCPGQCVYCPDFVDTPRSYTPHSPAVLRAATRGYDPLKQVALRLRIIKDMGHPVDKIELIVMGGTFLSTPVEYQNEFIKSCFDALNGFESETLAEAQRFNETTEHRAVGLCIETRPDVCRDDDIVRMIGWGTTRVELGVQTLDEDVYKIVRRGHDTDSVADATRRLRNAGLKVHYHWMPGLPGSTPERDLEMTRRLFDDDSFRPDGIKIYPTMVVQGTELERWQESGRYQPYSDETMTNLIAEMKKVIPPFVRISRVLRDIPAEYIIGGLKNSMRDGVQRRLVLEGVKCRCIRCREYGLRLRNKVPIGDPSLRRLDYTAAGGREIFLSYEDQEGTLFGLLRLRIQEMKPPELPESEGRISLIRELHVYGPELGLGARADNSAQHQGFGRSLVNEAIRIAAEEFGSSWVAVLSGIGARAYYRELGFFESSGYMLKRVLRGV